MRVGGGRGEGGNREGTGREGTGREGTGREGTGREGTGRGEGANGEGACNNSTYTHNGSSEHATAHTHTMVLPVTRGGASWSMYVSLAAAGSASGGQRRRVIDCTHHVHNTCTPPAQNTVLSATARAHVEHRRSRILSDATYQITQPKCTGTEKLTSTGQG